MQHQTSTPAKGAPVEAIGHMRPERDQHSSVTAIQAQRKLTAIALIKRSVYHTFAIGVKFHDGCLMSKSPAEIEHTQELLAEVLNDHFYSEICELKEIIKKDREE